MTESVTRALDFMRNAILEGSLSPGEKIHQKDVAEVIGISRIPLREALCTLAAEGLLSYTPNRGYTVPKLGQEEAKQIYRMRQLLEDDLMAQIREPSVNDIARLHRLNDAMISSINDDLSLFVSLNREFHFALFEMSGAELIVAELNRLWAMSDAYRAIYLYEPNNAERATLDHERIIAAVAARDTELTVRLLHEHRGQAESHVRRFLAIRNQGVPVRRSLAEVTRLR